MAGMDDTQQCEDMESACNEAQDFRSETRRLGLQSDIYRKNMQTDYDHKCSEEMKACQESQRKVQEQEIKVNNSRDPQVR